MMVFVLDTSVIEDRLKLKQKYVKNYAKYSFEDTVKNGHTSKSKTVKKVLDVIVENYKKFCGEFSSVSHVSFLLQSQFFLHLCNREGGQILLGISCICVFDVLQKFY